MRRHAVPEPNHALRVARERTFSRRTPGTCVSRDELADLVVQWLTAHDSRHREHAFDGNHLGKLERGTVARPRGHYVVALCAVLGASATELGFGAEGGVARSGVVQLGEEALVAAADESAQFLAWAEPSNVGELTIEQMHSDMRRIAHSYLKAPTVPLFARTRALRDRAFTLLSGHQDPRQTRELYAAAGWSLTVLAWMSVDLGRPDAAEQHARTAWLRAERADYNALRAWVRATQHTAAFWQDDYTTAADYAADGLRYAGTGTAELFLSSALALDLAHAGHTDQATAALIQAQRVADTAQRAEDELAGPFTCKVDRAGLLWSDTQLALGEADHALDFANHAVAAFEATPPDQRNLGSERMTRLQQVKAHLVLGDLDNAENALAPVLDTAPQHRVRPLLRRMAEAGALVATTDQPTSPIRRRIRDTVTDFHRDTVVKELLA